MSRNANKIWLFLTLTVLFFVQARADDAMRWRDLSGLIVHTAALSEETQTIKARNEAPAG